MQEGLELEPLLVEEEEEPPRVEEGEARSEAEVVGLRPGNGAEEGPPEERQGAEVEQQPEHELELARVPEQGPEKGPSHP